MKTYLAINLDDFHKNVKEGQTITQIRFISAESINKAKSLVIRNYPSHGWSLVSEDYFNKHIVLKQQSLKSSP